MALPSLVQAVSCSNIQSNTITSYVFELAHPTLAGNCLIVMVNSGISGAGTCSIADDKSNSYTLNINNFTGGGSIITIGSTMAATGTKKITVSFTGTTTSFVSASAAEFAGINSATADATVELSGGGGPSGGTAVSPGSLTTNAANDLLIQYSIQQNPGPTNPMQWTAGSGATLLVVDYQDGQASQFQIPSASGSVTPTMTMGAQNGFDCVAVAWKSAATGTPLPSGIRIVRLVHNAIAPGNSAATFKTQMNMTGNLLVMLSICTTGYQINSIADGQSDSISQIGSALTNASSGACQRFYAHGITPSSGTNVITYTTNNSGPAGGQTVFTYDIAGAASSPLDTDVTATGSSGAAGTFNGASITPAQANELILSQVGIESGTITASSDLFESNVINPSPGTGSVDQNNGWEGLVNSTTSAQQITWTVTGSVGAGNWASTATAFLPAPAASGTTAFGDDSWGVMCPTGFDEKVTVF